MHLKLKCSNRVLQIAAAIFPLVGLAASAQADIFQWEYINPADPSQGKRQSMTLAPDGAGVHALPGANLNGRNLTMAYLIGADLTLADVSANLTNADLSQANLTSSSFYIATLTGADFRQANLTNTSFNFANVTSANFAGQNLTNVSFEAATLTGADFTGAEVRGANFAKLLFERRVGTGVTLPQLYDTASYQAHDLTSIALYGNYLAGGNFAGQNLTDANCAYATLTDANFSQANLTGADFDYATLTGADFRQADLTNANLHYATLTGADFRQASLDNATLYHATLTGADFTRAKLSDGRFGGANLTGANLREANLANASFLLIDLLPPLPACVVCYATLTDADLTAADARGAFDLNLTDATTTNLILPDGHINGLELAAGDMLVVRDYHGPTWNRAFVIPITIDQQLTMAPGGTLRMVFEADAWDSTISFAPGIPVTLGGSLELTFADGVTLASQVGRTFDLFDWTGVTPIGSFAISSPYRWNLSNLYATGEVTLTAVPEPGRFVLPIVGALGLILYRRRKLS